MNEVKVFEHERFGKIRTLEINGEPWFVGKDVATLLEYRDTSDALKKHVDDDDKGVGDLPTPGGMQKVYIINESGLYSLIFGSKMKEAREFKRWVTHDVLPSIRKTGGYLTEAGKAAIIEEVKAAVIEAIHPPKVIPQTDPAKLAALLAHMRQDVNIPTAKAGGFR